MISKLGFFGARSQVATILYIVKKRTDFWVLATLSNSAKIVFKPPEVDNLTISIVLLPFSLYF